MGDSLFKARQLLLIAGFFHSFPP